MSHDCTNLCNVIFTGKGFFTDPGQFFSYDHDNNTFSAFSGGVSTASTVSTYTPAGHNWRFDIAMWGDRLYARMRWPDSYWNNNHFPDGSGAIMVIEEYKIDYQNCSLGLLREIPITNHCESVHPFGTLTAWEWGAGTMPYIQKNGPNSLRAWWGQGEPIQTGHGMAMKDANTIIIGSVNGPRIDGIGTAYRLDQWLLEVDVTTGFATTLFPISTYKNIANGGMDNVLIKAVDILYLQDTDQYLIAGVQLDTYGGTTGFRHLRLYSSSGTIISDINITNLGITGLGLYRNPVNNKVYISGINGTVLEVIISPLSVDLSTSQTTGLYAINGAAYPQQNYCQNLSGCTDPTASNYDPNAIVDDGSCLCYEIGDITSASNGGAGGMVFALPNTQPNNTPFYYEVALDDLSTGGTPIDHHLQFIDTAGAINNGEVSCGQGGVSSPLNNLGFQWQAPIDTGIPNNQARYDAVTDPVNTSLPPITNFVIGAPVQGVDQFNHAVFAVGTQVFLDDVELIPAGATSSNSGQLMATYPHDTYLFTFSDFMTAAYLPNSQPIKKLTIGGTTVNTPWTFSGAEWGGYGDEITPTTQHWWGTGHDNTSHIINNPVGPVWPSHDIAAELCNSYNPYGSFPNRWFLPSLEEFSMLFTEVAINNPSLLSVVNFSTDTAMMGSSYWTSSEWVNPSSQTQDEDFYAWAYNTDMPPYSINALPFTGPHRATRCSSLSVRPIRRFECVEPSPATSIDCNAFYEPVFAPNFVQVLGDPSVDIPMSTTLGVIPLSDFGIGSQWWQYLSGAVDNQIIASINSVTLNQQYIIPGGFLPGRAYARFGNKVWVSTITNVCDVGTSVVCGSDRLILIELDWNINPDTLTFSKIIELPGQVGSTFYRRAISGTHGGRALSGGAGINDTTGVWCFHGHDSLANVGVLETNYELVTISTNSISATNVVGSIVSSIDIRAMFTANGYTIFDKPANGVRSIFMYDVVYLPDWNDTYVFTATVRSGTSASHTIEHGVYHVDSSGNLLGMATLPAGHVGSGYDVVGSVWCHDGDIWVNFMGGSSPNYGGALKLNLFNYTWDLNSSVIADGSYLLPTSIASNPSCCPDINNLPDDPCDYQIGDTGPAGGVIFSVPGVGQNTSDFAYEMTHDWYGGSLGGILTGAPSSWNLYYDPYEDYSSNSPMNPTPSGAVGTEFACWNQPITSQFGTDTSYEFGKGQENTQNVISGFANTYLFNNGWHNIFTVADNFSLNGFNDWFVPSTDEVKEADNNGFDMNPGGALPATSTGYPGNIANVQLPPGTQVNDQWPSLPDEKTFLSYKTGYVREVRGRDLPFKPVRKFYCGPPAYPTGPFQYNYRDGLHYSTGAPLYAKGMPIGSFLQTCSADIAPSFPTWHDSTIGEEFCYIMLAGRDVKGNNFWPNNGPLGIGLFDDSIGYTISLWDKDHNYLGKWHYANSTYSGQVYGNPNGTWPSSVSGGANMGVALNQQSIVPYFKMRLNGVTHLDGPNPVLNYDNGGSYTYCYMKIEAAFNDGLPSNIKFEMSNNSYFYGNTTTPTPGTADDTPHLCDPTSTPLSDWDPSTSGDPGATQDCIPTWATSIVLDSNWNVLPSFPDRNGCQSSGCGIAQVASGDNAKIIEAATKEQIAKNERLKNKIIKSESKVSFIAEDPIFNKNKK